MVLANVVLTWLGLSASETPVSVKHMVVCRAWPGCYMVMPEIVTQIPGKVQTQPDGGEG